MRRNRVHLQSSDEKPLMDRVTLCPESLDLQRQKHVKGTLYHE